MEDLSELTVTLTSTKPTALEGLTDDGHVFCFLHLNSVWK